MAEELLLINPRKRTRRRRTPARRRTTATRRRTAARRNPAPRRRRRRTPARRRITRAAYNPRQRGVMGQVNRAMMPAVQGAAGALGLDLLMGMVPLPAAMSTGMVRHLVKGVGAVGVGMLAGMVARPATAQAMLQGSLTVVMHDAARETIQTTMPGIPLGYTGSGYSPDMAAYLDTTGQNALTDQSSNLNAYLDAYGEEYDNSYDM